ncbi:ABC transporter substrate-binding protein [Eoetvoesiella caeni]
MKTIKTSITPLLFGMALTTCLAVAFSGTARADITIGVILSVTGPAASLGQPAENSVKLWPDSIAGQKLRIIAVNDNSDPTEAARQATKLITENKVDVIVGPSITPPSIAAVETAGRNATPIIALGGGNAIIEPQEGPRKWAFKMAAPEATFVERTLEHMIKNKVKKVAAISVTTSYGEGFLKAFNAQAPTKGLTIISVEKYGAQDLGVTAQVIRTIAAKPDAVFIFSFGTPAVLPQAELLKRGYKGKIYQTQGVANADFLRVGAQSVEGTYIALAPVMVAEQLPESNPTKKIGMEYITKYEALYGPGSRSYFGTEAWTALNWLQATIPVALQKAKPGTPEFRQALRNALENMHDVVSPEGVFNMSPGNHNGIDARGQVMVEIKDGKWKYIP